MRKQLMTRRAFLKSTAASLSLPYVITSSALGGGGKPAASERLIMGCIGLGGQGTAGMGWRSAGPNVPNTNWVPKGGFMARGVHVMAVCDVNKNNLKRAKSVVDQEYGNNDCRPYKQYQELLAREDIDNIISRGLEPSYDTDSRSTKSNVKKTRGRPRKNNNNNGNGIRVNT